VCVGDLVEGDAFADAWTYGVTGQQPEEKPIASSNARFERRE